MTGVMRSAASGAFPSSENRILPTLPNNKSRAKHGGKARIPPKQDTALPVGTNSVGDVRAICPMGRGFGFVSSENVTEERSHNNVGTASPSTTETTPENPKQNNEPMYDSLRRTEKKLRGYDHKPSGTGSAPAKPHHHNNKSTSESPNEKSTGESQGSYLHIMKKCQYTIPPACAKAQQTDRSLYNNKSPSDSTSGSGDETGKLGQTDESKRIKMQKKKRRKGKRDGILRLHRWLC